ncbi:MAG: diacylglycerol/lipid kinase family protein [Anaerolineales bacterium]
MVASVILNPYANRWRALKRQPEMEKALQSAGITYDLVKTTQPGEGVKLAYQAVLNGYSPIIAAGGDGSISDVANGIMQAIQEKNLTPPPLGIIPLGSANDLVVNLGLPLDLNKTCQIIKQNQFRWIDLGKVNQRYFDNNSAIGLEPSITLIQQQISYPRGTLRYLLATLIGVMRKPSWQVELEWEGGSYSGLVSLVTVGNCAVTGGLFYMTPHANPFDGLLTFVYGYIPTRLQILQILPKTMKKDQGSYVEHPSIHEVHSSWLKIHALQPTPLHADGEIQSKAIHDISYQIIPKCLPIIMPPEAA